ncbi:FtsK/SpoIIIE family DNA translocase [Anaplasma phagocytophilum]|uniref:FtsK/SpoIIIE family DNA translocase n=1 Tax=Anaplasma phagocytophilum TaxID=948 RepID=UPI0007E0B637|nr:DNA translocase FtsK 4TM domain-containing protein [Anaplasma phagocytophilum]SBO29887.1 DNA translocase FtsK [Anaplasma phagocytophilum]SBO30460.1 DNA translocase FtsK [Anaplasma phagocytophilum]SBO31332.1 DNA translocase FtsK [Anaplasma phagocytophilum]SCV61600.1 DNA translocase FtsK [Anaplasma phagocytophilum]
MKYIAGLFRFCVVLSLVVFLEASVITYNACDSALNSTGCIGTDAGEVSNLMGTAGAYLADVLVQLFGMAGVVPGILTLAWLQKLPKFVRRIYIPALCLVTVSIAGILAKFSFKATSVFHYGGFVGQKFESFSLITLIAAASIGIFSSIGWQVPVFFARILVKLLSRLRLRVSAGRLKDNESNNVSEIAVPTSYVMHGVNTAGEGTSPLKDHTLNKDHALNIVQDDDVREHVAVEHGQHREYANTKIINTFAPSGHYGYEEKFHGVPEQEDSAIEEQYEKDQDEFFDEEEEFDDCELDDSFEEDCEDDMEDSPLHDEPRYEASSTRCGDVDIAGEDEEDVALCQDEEEYDEDDWDIDDKEEDEECEIEEGSSSLNALEPDEDDALECEEDYDLEEEDDLDEDDALEEEYEEEEGYEEDDDASYNQEEVRNFTLPHVELLEDRREHAQDDVDDSACKNESEELYEVLKDFGVYGKIIDVRYGPVVTLYEFEPSAGTKSSRIIGLSDDIARSMSALSTRISVVPGRNVMGIELPNRNRKMVVLRDLIESKEYLDRDLKLPIILGKGIDGEPVVGDLTKMPHLLIAGTTGSGKSVGINTMILSLLYRLTPDQCRMIMIDPKVLELSVYDNIPHLLTPVVTEAKKAVAVLKWVVAEMEERYRLMSAVGVRNITGYNEKIAEAACCGEVFKRTVQTGYDKDSGEPIFEQEKIKNITLPYIVVIVDEMADLMIVSGKEIESSIQRLSQMARAAGIHIIMATQRPSVDVITGVIKANFPTRISFSVTSRVDSRTILGEQGAEQLLGMGDMLYMVAGGKIRRIHGAFVSDNEVQDVVNHLRMQCKPRYVEGIARALDSSVGDEISTENFDGKDDALYEKAVSVVLRDRKTSVSYVQRQLRIGYNRAANIVERMEREGIITEVGHLGKREIVD